MSQPRTADLAAHLELVEQNITLTLQQIDHNFAACHNTVATKLLPRIDKFSDLSRQIWISSQAWLSFFQSLESSQKASIPLPPSPTETSNTPDRSARVELSTRLEYSHAPSYRSDLSKMASNVPVSAQVGGGHGRSLLSAIEPSLVHTPVKPNLPRSIIGDSASNSAASPAIHSAIHADSANYDPSQISNTSGIISIDPPSLHFRSLHMNNSILRGTPMKARPPKITSTPRLLQQVLTAATKAKFTNKNKRQTSTPRNDPHALFDVATPFSDASTSDDDDDGVGRRHPGKFNNNSNKHDSLNDVDQSNDHYLAMNSPPVTLQFTMPIAKTPGRTAVDAILEEMSPVSNSPSNTEFLTRIQETTMKGKNERGKAMANMDSSLFGPSTTAAAGPLGDLDANNPNMDIKVDSEYRSAENSPRPMRKSNRWSPELSSTPMPFGRPQPPKFTQHNETPFGMSATNDQSQISNIPSSAIANVKTTMMDVDIDIDSKETLSKETDSLPTFDLSLFPGAFQVSILFY
ncbi:DASH complex subunit Ask1-domain-containing protein [Syncephalis fuscata]|nr:DASH complex subunit Ask1-domain-containing protein [Syncephalis fuscata]